MKNLPESLLTYARERGLAEYQALQVFLQVLVLKNITWDEKRMIGGTVLVLGHSNPRFSEDIDLTSVKNILDLEKDLKKSVHEIEVWFQSKVVLSPPKKNTWKLSLTLREHSRIIRLHIDSQKYPTHSYHPIIVSFPGIPAFVVPSVALEEILADKLIALAFRNYIGGRDVFDLWYHWFQGSRSQEKNKGVLSYLEKKKKDSGIDGDVIKKICERLKGKISERCRDEWDRYLPQNFRNEKLHQDIYSTVLKKIKKLKV